MLALGGIAALGYFVWVKWGEDWWNDEDGIGPNVSAQPSQYSTYAPGSVSSRVDTTPVGSTPNSYSSQGVPVTSPRPVGGRSRVGMARVTDGSGVTPQVIPNIPNVPSVVPILSDVDEFGCYSVMSPFGPRKIC